MSCELFFRFSEPESVLEIVDDGEVACATLKVGGLGYLCWLYNVVDGGETRRPSCSGMIVPPGFPAIDEGKRFSEEHDVRVFNVVDGDRFFFFIEVHGDLVGVFDSGERWGYSVHANKVVGPIRPIPQFGWDIYERVREE